MRAPSRPSRVLLDRHGTAPRHGCREPTKNKDARARDPRRDAAERAEASAKTLAPHNHDSQSQSTRQDGNPMETRSDASEHRHQSRAITSSSRDKATDGTEISLSTLAESQDSARER